MIAGGVKEVPKTTIVLLNLQQFMKKLEIIKIVLKWFVHPASNWLQG